MNREELILQKERGRSLRVHEKKLFENNDRRKLREMRKTLQSL